MQGKKLWGVDLGGTKIECAILDANLDTIVRRRIATESAKGYAHLLQRIKKLVTEIAEEIGEQPSEIGFATPGVLEPDSMVMKNCNTVCMNGEPMHKDLEHVLGVPVKLANDANCFALAETVMGVGREHPNANVVFGVILGTGVGGGIVVNNRIIGGKHGLGGEWGHNELEENGEECYCGKRGCVERVISGPALESYYHSLSAGELSLSEIDRKYRHDPDPFVSATMERLLENYGKAISVVLNILDPDLVIIGGGVGNIDLLYSEGYERIKKYIFNNGKLTTPVCKPALGDSSGVYGAALLWADPKKYVSQCL
ncbi:ROK family protein [Segetibacter sp. 3557_3]|uniref:ROK family protein n=1 Tax=Segetibacter sp. 3557_3 TaxID=2547429 RepID=UPI00105893AC|nr:ROK family protein [Segetibacter sp. 3557_3]TDH24224.1 ROK family protein [Segetibacter sp. 3557_3]